MLNDIILNYKDIHVYVDNKEYTIPDIKNYLTALFESSYFTPSVATLDNAIDLLRVKGIWIELDYGKEISIRNTPFCKLLFSIKPKYDYINLIRYDNGKYQGKCLGLTLAHKTTEIYNNIRRATSEEN